jgi:hypothetical protein
MDARRMRLERKTPAMDHYIPKRRIPVTLWSTDGQGIQGQVFLDLDAARNRHQTILEKANESARFLPVAVGPDGRIHLFNKLRLTRVTAGRQVIQSDVFARGFEPWREEPAEVVLVDGAALEGRVWTPLQRETQRLSDFMNMQGAAFFVLLTQTGIHLVNTAAVVEMRLTESAGAPLVAPPEPGTEASAA